MYVTYTVNFWMEKSELNKSKYNTAANGRSFMKNALNCARQRKTKNIEARKNTLQRRILTSKKIGTENFQNY